MPEQPSDAPSERDDAGGGVFSGFGIAATVLALLAVVAVVLATLIWSGHRADVDERRYQTAVLQTAAEWTGVLVNMSADNVEASLQILHEGTVGELNADFESVLEPYRQLVQKLQSRTRGQIDSVSIETLHQELPPPGGGAQSPRPARQPELEAWASRTDTVLVVATSMSDNVGDEPPQTVRWNLRLGVSDVDGRLAVSRLETIR